MKNVDINIVAAEEDWWYTSAVIDFENDLKSRNDVVVYGGKNYYIKIDSNCSICFLNNKLICAHKGNTVWEQFLWLKEIIYRSKDDKHIFDDELSFYSGYLVEDRYNINMDVVLRDLVIAFDELLCDDENFDDGIVTTLRNTTEASLKIYGSESLI